MPWPPMQLSISGSRWEVVQKSTARCYADLNWRFLSGPVPQRLGNSAEVGMENSERTWPTETTQQGSHGLPDTDVASTGPEWVCTRSSV